MVRLWCGFLVLCLAWPVDAGVAPEFSGRLRVIDGDTFAIGDRRVRLFGVDAPEKKQRCGGAGVPMWQCGAWVTGEVRARYQDQPARCVVLAQDHYGRSIARCFVRGEDLGQTLVQGGLAFAYRNYSMLYVPDERQAASRKAGLHAVGVQSPAEFRRASRKKPVQQVRADGCAIKGNISRTKERIYHMPGQRFYARVSINEARNERWFCTENDAIAAGWRKAKQ